MDEDNKLQFLFLPATKDDLLDWAYPMRREMQEIFNMAKITDIDLNNQP
uniref:Uncharacterized protein n=1 Tax=Acanthochromis polyacanthus TaxID=80966 RepID=A0A3Q1GIH6_9TELE